MIRKPAVAGQFYEADPAELRKEVASYLKGAAPVKGPIFGLVAPHAGYVFSGANAGKAFAHLKDVDFDTAVVISTGHRMGIRGAALMTEGDFETPLGRVSIDTELAEDLLKASSVFEDLPEVHKLEHAVEVELPFLQVLKGDKFRMVPIAVNTDDQKVLAEAGRALGKALKGKKAVVCVSSDLSHYPPAAIAERSDSSLMMAFRTAVNTGDLSYFGLAANLLSEKAGRAMDTPACGQAAMTMGAAACLELGADDFELLEYTHSGKISGDNSRVVGYAAGLFVKSGPREPALPEKLKEELLKYARASIENYLKLKKPLEMPLSVYPELNQPAAVFVTLTKGGRLRGCIGTMEPRGTLADAVTEYAVAAAFGDPRFGPLTREELRGIRIEISVLSPLKRVDSYKDIVENKHGVYVRKGRASGTYLPQVWEHFESRDDFLSSLCLEKAGLDAAAWKERSTELYVYTVDHFEEK